ncbi:xanthine dehydrogenase accessory protein XdhC [Paraglaciecola polaris]|uniref:Xanthine dehydrogenase accessory factor n=1 Tax=Paraglaciecola polaris LMG 21857 TaxID=1129793 RepID=K6Z8Z3_9ALTE|nr:xanthine dehydrogenase accessory protein XdhC [Paraglaciecola polaris]GAC32641.1 xanthine dehydrogenase accessory factor [Paraglaciecola polaris LMG 21857]|tara:strand:- start:9518 stop:10414 length:897 start_codon:yes stop_codon:yes gene_type:complete
MNTNKWFDALQQCQEQGKAYVLVTVLASAGSTPRGNGTKMIVTGDETFDTIGGGQLEFAATEKARVLLAGKEHTQHVEHYPLSSKLGQCCGGAVNILFEVMIEQCQTVQIFGAGHVAHALVPLLAQLPLQIQWIDHREVLFPRGKPTFDFANLKMIVSDEPTEHIALAPDNSWMVIMTHNHQLDYELVEAALKRPDLPYIGMIGSSTKAKRFVTRIAARMPDVYEPTRLVSPIGVVDIPGKRPIEVAVSIAGQLIQRLNSESVHNEQSVNTNENSKSESQRQKQAKAWRAAKELKYLL